MEGIGTSDLISKRKKERRIIIRNPEVLKAVIFCDSHYATDKETRKNVSGLVATLGGTLLMCSSNTQRTITLSSKYEDYEALSACLQEVNFSKYYLKK